MLRQSPTDAHFLCVTPGHFNDLDCLLAQHRLKLPRTCDFRQRASITGECCSGDNGGAQAHRYDGEVHGFHKGSMRPSRDVRNGWKADIRTGYAPPMSKQGFQLSEASDSGMLPGEGYGAAKVTIGDFSETAFFSTAVWAPDDYIEHFKQSAQACLKGESAVVFCTDYAPPNSTCMVVWAANKAFVSQQMIVPTSTLRLEGHRLVWAQAALEFWSQGSQWPAAASDLAEIAAM